MDVFEPVEALEEELFPPKPGGMIDKHRKEKARRAAVAAEAANVAQRIEEASYKAVKVAPESPETIACTTVNIGAGSTAMVLPNSPYRYRATLIASVAVILGKDSSQALGQTGFMLPANLPFVVQSRAQLWAYANAAASISVLAEIYAPELGKADAG